MVMGVLRSGTLKSRVDDERSLERGTRTRVTSYVEPRIIIFFCSLFFYSSFGYRCEELCHWWSCGRFSSELSAELSSTLSSHSATRMFSRVPSTGQSTSCFISTLKFSHVSYSSTHRNFFFCKVIDGIGRSSAGTVSKISKLCALCFYRKFLISMTTFFILQSQDL